MLPHRVMAAAEADRLALLADVHVSGGCATGMAKRLSVVVKQILEKRPQMVLVAGDCAYLKGKVADYREYMRRVRPLAEAGVSMHVTLGNHDHRERFWDMLPGERRPHRQAMVVEGRNANWFLLDSLGKTNGAGELGKDQLEWLAAELDGKADRPAIVMLHHDPIRNGKVGGGSLADSERLMAIVRSQRQVKAMVWGHTHAFNVSQDVSGIHLINLPATGYKLWGRSFLGWVGCEVHAGHTTLRVHTLNAQRKENGATYQLKWRV